MEKVHMQKPVVSITITTYNLEKYVEKTIQSVVDQQTAFPIEVVIGDDCSTDHTREIILDMQQKHPHISWKLIFNETNEGVSVLFPKVIHACKGDYIATLDGDDYWTDPLKLQKQYDFIQSQKEFKACCTDYSIIDENENIIHKDYFKSWDNNHYTFENILSSLTPPRHTLFFSQEVVPNPFPVNYAAARINDDHYLMALVAEKTNIAVMDVNTAHYRKHTGGLYSKKPYDYKVKNLIGTNKLMLQHFTKAKHKKILTKTISGLYIGLNRYYLYHFKPIKFINAYFAAVFFMLQRNLSELFKMHYHLLLLPFKENLKTFNLD